jgi:decaprenylphospho-beta-D-ribofuranose 2-oxidase
MDLPHAGHPNLDRFMADLDAAVIDAGGIANIAKDSRIPAKAVGDMYRDAGTFWEKLRRFDPERRFSSALRRRIELA